MKFFTKISLFVCGILVSFGASANRLTEYLETVEINKISFMWAGLPDCDGHRVAAVRDGGGYYHAVIVGSYLGKNQGRISKIERTKMFVTELVQNEKGEYIERPLTFVAIAPNDDADLLKTQNINRSIAEGGNCECKNKH